MRAHVIENDKVVNTIVVDSLDAMPDLVLIEATEGSIGWDYIGGVLSAPEVDIEAERDRIQTENKSACKATILLAYSEETQRNAALGLYSTETVEIIADYISACVAEENRVFDLLEVAEDPTTVEKPTWPGV